MGANQKEDLQIEGAFSDGTLTLNREVGDISIGGFSSDSNISSSSIYMSGKYICTLDDYTVYTNKSPAVAPYSVNSIQTEFVVPGLVGNNAEIGLYSNNRDEHYTMNAYTIPANTQLNKQMSSSTHAYFKEGGLFLFHNVIATFCTNQAMFDIEVHLYQPRGDEQSFTFDYCILKQSLNVVSDTEFYSPDVLLTPYTYVEQLE